MGPALTHTDGSPCLEGSSKVPEGWQPCCEVFDDHTRACVYDVRYEWRSTGWVTAISSSAGGGGITMNFCPHCGASLAGTKEP
jgi:hypothetical protein